MFLLTVVLPFCIHATIATNTSKYLGPNEQQCEPTPCQHLPFVHLLTPPVNLYPNIFLCLKFVVVTSCSRCVEKHGIHVKSIRNPSSVLIFLLELLLVHYLKHLVKYLKTMCQSSPPTPILPSSFSRNYSRKEQRKLVKHSIKYSTVKYSTVEEEQQARCQPDIAARAGRGRAPEMRFVVQAKLKFWQPFLANDSHICVANFTLFYFT